jgi:protein-disulfide isomerase
MTTVRLLALLLLGLPAAALAQTDTLIAPRAKGSAKAPVTVYEMSDLQCPFCKRFAEETFPTLEKEYINTGKVRWVFIHMPMTEIHANAVPAAEFATCAMKQGKFWATHDRLYATQEKWEALKDPTPFFVAQIAPLGLRRDAMQACLAGPEARRFVRSDAAGAARSGARATPSFFIEGGMMAGALPTDVFRKVLDSIVAAKSPKRPG